jgi:hypothetical protein
VVECTSGSRREIPGERKPVMRDDDDDDDGGGDDDDDDDDEEEDENGTTLLRLPTNFSVGT